MTDREITYKYGATGIEDVTAKLNGMADASDQATKKLTTGGKGASDVLLALDDAAGQVKGKLHDLADEAGPLGEILTKFGPAGLAAAAAFGATAGAIIEMAKVSDDAARTHLKLQAALNATGTASGQTAKGIMDLSVQIAGSTMATRDQVEQAAQQLLAFRTVTGDAFGQVLKLSQDLAASGFGSLTENVVKLGRAMEDPVAGLTALSREGMVFSQGLKDQITDLAKHGDALQAQGLILAELQKRIGGVGEADADSLTGALHKAGEAWKEFVEAAADRSGLSSVTSSVAQWMAGLATGLQPQNQALANIGAQLIQISKLESDLARVTNSDDFKAGYSGPLTYAANLRVQIAALQDTVASENFLLTAADKDAKMKAVGAQAEIKLSDAISNSNDVRSKAKDLMASILLQMQEEDDRRQSIIAGLGVELDSKTRILTATLQGSDALAALNTQLAIEANLRKLGTGATEEEIAASRAETIGIQAATNATKAYNDSKLKLKQDEQTIADIEKQQADEATALAQKQYEAIQKFAQDAGSHVVDAFVDMLTGAKNPLAGLEAYAKQIFAKIVADALLNPIIIPAVMQLVNGAAGYLGADGAPGGGGSNILSTAASGAGAAGSLGLFTGAGSSVANYINGLGIQYLGTGGSVAGLPGVAIGDTGITGGAVDGFTVAGPSLTGILGGAGLGAVGGNIFASITGGNKTVDSLGGAAAGAALMAGHPEIAAAIAIVSALAGMFGPGPSDMQEGYQFNPNSNVPGTQVGNAPGSAKFSSTNLSNATNFQSVIQAFTTSIAGASGGTYGGGTIGFDTGNRDGSHVYFYDNGSGPNSGGGGQTQFSDPQSALAYTEQRITTLFTGLAPDVETAFKNIDWTGDLQTNLGLIQFASDFQANIKAMEDGTLSIQDDAYTAAAAQVSSYVTQIQTFKDTTAQLGLSTGDADQATQDFVKRLVGLGDTVAPESDLQKALDQLRGTFSAIGPLLTEVGLDASHAGDLLQKAIDGLAASFDTSIQSQINDVSGNGFLNTIATAWGNFQKNLSDATTLGEGPEKVTELFNDTVQGIITGGNLTVDQLTLIATTFANIPSVVAMANKAIAGLTVTVAGVAPSTVAAVGNWQSILGTLFDQQISNTQDQIKAAQDLSDAWGKVRDDIRAGSDALLVDPTLSPLSAEARRQAAFDQFSSAVSAAQGGDVNAAAQIPDLERTFLTASQAFYHSSSDYANDFATAQAMAASVANYASSQVTIEQMQLTTLNAILATLQGQESILSGANKPAGYNAADAAAVTGKYGDALAASGLSEVDFINSAAGQAWIPARNALIAGTTDPALLLQYYSDAQGQVATPGLQSVGTDYENLVAAQLRAQGIPIPSFDTGGLVRRTGLAMVHQGENVVSNKHTTEMIGLLRQLVGQVSSQTDVHVESGNRSLAVLNDVSASLSRSAQTAELAYYSGTSRPRVLRG